MTHPEYDTVTQPGEIRIGCGLLGATGRSHWEASENRLRVIEERILALEARALANKEPNHD